MSETPGDFMAAARVPTALAPKRFGPWTIRRFSREEVVRRGEADEARTVLYRLGDVVMEDGVRELRRHLPIWLAAHGRVLVAGLGLGCVVRGLLASPRVEHVDVVEIDAGIMRVVGAEFASNPRVRLHHGDALTYEFPAGTRWNCAWYDILTRCASEHVLHAALFHRYRGCIARQGAWQFPRWAKRLARHRCPGVVG